MLMITCEECQGSKLNAFWRELVGIMPDGTLVAPMRATEDKRREREPIKTCETCSGFGITKRGTYGAAFRTASTAKSARTKGTAQTCRTCQGERRSQWIPAEQKCYSCTGTGEQIGLDPADPRVPTDRLYDSASREFMRDYAAFVEIVVIRQDRAGTWGEAYLGSGIVSVTDYGDTFALTDDAVIAGKATEHLVSNRTQFLNIADRETGQLAKRVGVVVHRNGWTLQALEITTRNGYAGLPPTYTPELLNSPV